MVLGGLGKAVRLEFNAMKEKKFSMLFFLFVPSIIASIFANIASRPISWGSYGQLNITAFDLYAPVVLSLIILFVAIQLTVLRIVGERAPYGTLDRDLLAISRGSMYIGKLLVNFLFSLSQCVLIFLTITMIYPVKNYGNPFIILLFLIMIGLFAVALGLLISTFVTSKEQAIQLIPFLILTLFIFSGILQVEVPAEIERITINSPMSLVNESLKATMLDGVGFEDVISNFYKLLGWNAAIIGVGLLKFKLERKR